jgi:RNA polymerase primary sigma factor
LDAPVGEDDDTSFGDLVGDESAENPFDSLHTKTLSSDVSQMIENLDERESEIIKLRFGLTGESPLTLEEVGQRFEITRERVRQLQNIALQKMRRTMADRNTQRTREEIEEETRERKKMEVLHEFFEEKVAPKQKD